ncbi:MAG: flagellar protein FlgA [Geminicoccaceae bacterium]|nr:flagellar protein FlgA [Geminicoccaceae bacterium]
MRTLRMLAVLLLGLYGSAAAAAGPVATLPGGVPLTQRFTQDLLSAALAAVAPGEEFDLELEEPRLPLANPLSSATAIAVEELHFDAGSGRFSALLVGTVGDQIRFRLPAQGRAQSLIELPVLSRPVAAGERIAAADLDWIRVAPSRLRPTSVTEAGQLIGSEARRALQPGRMLSERDLQPSRLVARGRAVQLVYHRPGLELQALGIAQGDGALGEPVRVVNLDSRQQLQGVVIGPDRVALGGLPGAGGSASR